MFISIPEVSRSLYFSNGYLHNIEVGSSGAESSGEDRAPSDGVPDTLLAFSQETHLLGVTDGHRWSQMVTN